MALDLTRFGRNVLFSVVILVVVYSISRADLPMTHRVEEYIAYVLSTEFDYSEWLGDGEREGIRGTLARLRSWAPWLSGDAGEIPAVPATTDR